MLGIYTYSSANKVLFYFKKGILFIWNILLPEYLLWPDPTRQGHITNMEQVQPEWRRVDSKEHCGCHCCWAHIASFAGCHNHVLLDVGHSMGSKHDQWSKPNELLRVVYKQAKEKNVSVRTFLRKPWKLSK